MARGGRTFEQDAEQVAKDSQNLPESATRFSYGKRFAKTEEMYQARAMERELEELARQDGALDDPPRRKTAQATGAKTGGKKKAGAQSPEATLQSRHQVLEHVTRGAPIGSVPPSTEAPPQSALSDVVGDAQRYWSMLRGGLKDVSTAGVKLARLPLDVMMLAVGRLRPHHA